MLSVFLTIRAAAPLHTVTCAPLSAIGNGTIEYFPRTSADIPLGTAAIYQCDEGFYLSLEERVRTCEDREGAGVFSGQTPSCVCKSVGLTLANHLQLC